jgi:hypothetical protein
MDWSQPLTIIGSIVAPVMLAIFGAAFAVYRASKSDTKEIKDDINREIAIIREQTNIMDANHRADMKASDDKWERLFEKMDSKWERLFEKHYEGRQKA